MPSESPLIKELYNIKVGFEKLSLLIKQNIKRASIFYTSRIDLNRYKRMKDAFKQNDVYLDEIENQNDLLKDQLLEASLTADIKILGHNFLVWKKGIRKIT
ncbi:hypothetical protein Tco_0620149 [Tanacetum coccineum]